MTQNNGFLGTIGYIKANLMSSPALQDKGYSNENFYPGAESIPESEPKATFLPIQLQTSYVDIDENGIATFNIYAPQYSSGCYADLLNTPDLSTLQNWELGFKAQLGIENSKFAEWFCGIVTNVANDIHQAFMLYNNYTFMTTFGGGDTTLATSGDYYQILVDLHHIRLDRIVQNLAADKEHLGAVPLAVHLLED